MPRVIALIAALAVCAGFAVVVRQATSVDGAAADLASPDRPSAAQARRTAARIDHAGTLNPTTDPDLLRAKLALTERRLDDAHRLLSDIVDREPANLEAWSIIAVAFPGDTALIDRAKAAVARYSPPVPDA